MGIVVIGAVFVDIKGYPLSTYIVSYYPSLNIRYQLLLSY